MTFLSVLLGDFFTVGQFENFRRQIIRYDSPPKKMYSANDTITFGNLTRLMTYVEHDLAHTYRTVLWNLAVQPQRAYIPTKNTRVLGVILNTRNTIVNMFFYD